MAINWVDEVPGSVLGTLYNRARMMGMQGFASNNATITEVSDTETRIVEINGTEGTTTTNIVENGDTTTITEQFAASNGQTITKTTTITESSVSITLSASVVDN